MTVVFIGGSRRKDSLNAKLKHRLAEVADKHGIRHDIVDADALDAPIYHGDLEAADGVPESMKKLAEKIQSASKVVLVSPEYNSSVSPLIKNAIDWVSRVETQAWAGKTVLLAAASPGGLGGIRGLSHLRDILGNVKAWTAPLFACCPNANDESIAAMDESFLKQFLEQGEAS
ncbi:NAD(P)H-dependent oxidoreductase [Idiomarina loihiensis]|jgi:NAD(P)H-dependent FMN reductase|uniref:Predicted flavoprotein n=1 Tax=Idiomarina loihiensis (strain ATCC BAA-735 / DSM 15497 / L2-TR) TaxID=283942 RepID=Q5QV24_IDILO|nr:MULTISPECIES: NAD(P)H-dependent oxidoreductase [Idiomarina]NWO03806.1 NAD(P)H-dependent oxidoreductase [Idiomarinaceae bacterium]AAV83275.1 Predicted flavoprotein [Idiomarina loihiensis L2TR]AGM37318.1 flavoprotein [Idiomarina loihiensis GSL 199]MAA62584.1 NADPH-dependent oxidoreductase [Idiomarina sp.]MBL4856770.1 NAD(P)H-dependent oxidoreductase [Idiomarina sp.]|tara:strand:+ start:4295 stop:4813 length:519 start_codon:yes stop_codon:yes gene_type:complete